MLEATTEMLLLTPIQLEFVPLLQRVSTLAQNMAAPRSTARLPSTVDWRNSKDEAST
jgi:hypothetical protein